MINTKGIKIMDSDVKGIIHLFSENERSENQLLGDWTVKQLVEAKQRLNDFLYLKLKKRLEKEKQKRLDVIRNKKHEHLDEFYDKLNPKEQELYQTLSADFRLISCEELTDEEAEELISVLENNREKNQEELEEYL